MRQTLGVREAIVTFPPRGTVICSRRKTAAWLTEITILTSSSAFVSTFGIVVGGEVVVGGVVATGAIVVGASCESAIHDVD
jgi:hypothetical protein